MGVLAILNPLTSIFASPPSKMLARRLAVVAIVMLLPPLAYSTYVFVKDSGAVADGRELSVLMVQPNIDPWNKFDANTSATSLGKTLALTNSGMARHKPDLIIWPETAVSFFFRDEETVQEFVKRAVSRWDVPLLTGTLDRSTYGNLQTIEPLRESEHGNAKVFNAALLLTPEPPEPRLAGKEKGSGPEDTVTYTSARTKQRFNVKTSELYHKRVLMPFAERVPFVDKFPVLSRLAINFGGVGAFSPGREATVFSFEDKHGERIIVAAPICYEQQYPAQIAEFVRNGAEMLAFITNEGWWSQTHGAYQVAAFTRLRAIETRRSIARCANTGVTGFIDPLGRIYDQVPWWSEQTVIGKVRLSKAMSLYVRYPDYLPKVCVWIVLGLAISAIIQKARSLVGGSRSVVQAEHYVTGGFVGNIVFNTAPQTTLTSTQDDDFFVAKYDSGGHPVWARAANGPTGLPAGLSLDGGLAIAVDSQGNSFVGGGFVKTLAFKNASNNTVATLNSAGGMLNFEAFVAKYSADLTLLWAVGGMSGAAQDAGDLNNGLNGIDAIVLDGAGNPYVGGSVAGTNFLGTPVSAADTSVSQILLSRLNPANGAPLWVSVTGGTRNDEVTGLAIDGSADLYVMGDIASTTTFPTQPPITLTDNGHFVNSFVAKYNKKGHCLWVKQIGGLEFIDGTHLAVNGAGQIYVTGEFDGSVTFGSTTLNESEPGAHEDGLGGFLAKLDADGQTWLWAREFDGLGERVALDGAGNPFITGTFFDHAAFGAENQSTAHGLNSMAEEDQFVAKYDAAGNFKFAKALPGDGEGSENIIYSALANVDVIPVQLVYNRATGSMNVCGDFSGLLTLDNLMLNSGANRHGFVAALETVPPPAITSAQLNGKNLLVSGMNFDGGALILLNGIEQRTKNDNQNPTGLLTGKKLGNQIAPGQSVRLQVRNFDGKLSAEFIFVRPTG